jgi:2-keto-4-pentenoate hydratase/2-oxohepta-3-ene-1,7-dioic acid hydratase in catechol pathway
VKLARVGRPGEERPVLVDSHGVYRDISEHVTDISADTLSTTTLARIARLDPESLPAIAADSRIGPCVGRMGKFICIGLNYADHAAETGSPIPKEPVIFMKATSAIVGPNDEVIQPRDSTKLDWEVELGVVIGTRVRYVSEAAAGEYIAGYCVVNDVSERAFQLERGGTWDKGKGCDTFGPIGPWLVTPDEAGDVANLSIWLDVNGMRCQNGSTRTMIFKPAFIVSYVSRFMTLYPGDLISTGTPPGVGLGQKPPKFLRPGDVMELGIEGLGRQRQTVVGDRH